MCPRSFFIFLCSTLDAACEAQIESDPMFGGLAKGVGFPHDP